MCSIVQMISNFGVKFDLVFRTLKRGSSNSNKNLLKLPSFQGYLWAVVEKVCYFCELVNQVVLRAVEYIGP